RLDRRSWTSSSLASCPHGQAARSSACCSLRGESAPDVTGCADPDLLLGPTSQVLTELGHSRWSRQERGEVVKTTLRVYGRPAGSAKSRRDSRPAERLHSPYRFG